MVSFIGLNQLQAPDTRIDFSPVSNALSELGNVRRENEQQAYNRKQREDEKAYSRGRDAKQDAQQARQWKRQDVEYMGKRALAVSQMPDSAAKQVAWKSLLAEHGGGDLTPEEMDHRTGPNIMAAAAGQWNDPLDREIKQAQVAKMRADAAGGGDLPSNIKEWNAFQKMTPDQQKQYLSMKRATENRVIGDSIIDRSTGAIIKNVSGNIAGEAAAKEIGEAKGTAAMDLPRQEDNASLALGTIERIRNHPGKERGLGWTAVSGYIPNTDERGFANLVDQAKGQVFLEAFNSLRGGGQITEAEGAKATQALARLDRYQSQSDFDAALKDLESVIKSGRDRARTKAGVQQPQEQQKNLPAGAPPQAVQMLMSDPSPEAMKEFDDVFGQGAAMRVLGNGR